QHRRPRHDEQRRHHPQCDEAGGRAATRAEASTHLEAARACLAATRPAPAAARDLDALVGSLLDRAW
ncbi:hypothetical protein ABZ675_28070, partial [Streptomyces albidoflavus]